MRAVVRLLFLFLVLCVAPVSAQEPSPLEGEFLTPGYHRVTGGHADVVVGFHPERGLTLLLRDRADQQPVWRPMSDVVFVLGEKASGELPPFAPAPTSVAGRAWVIPGMQGAATSLGWALDGPGIDRLDVQGAALRLKHVEGPGDFMVVRGGHQGQVLWTTGNDQPFAELWLETNEHSVDSWVFYEPGTYKLSLEAQVGLYTSRGVLTVEVGTFADQTFVAAKEGTWLRHGLVLSALFLGGIAVWWVVRRRALRRG